MGESSANRFKTLTSETTTIAQLGRNQLFAALGLIAFANGIVGRVARDVQLRAGWDLLFNTLEISVIVWAALAAGAMFLFRSRHEALSRTDFTVAALASLAIVIPVAPASWLALTLIAWHLVRTAEEQSLASRGGWILFAVTIPMFWSRIIFSLFSDTILSFDAVLVGWIVGTSRVGNAVEFADGSGYLWIAPDCSSLANVSLAVLCYVLFSQTHLRQRPVFAPGLVAAACAAVVAVNVLRSSLIGLYSEQFELLHGSLGNTIASWLTVVLVFGILAFGMRNDRLAIW